MMTSASVGGRGGHAGLGLLVGTLPGTLHLLMNDGVIHRHPPLRHHGGGWLVGAGRHGSEAQLRRQAGRDFLMRRQSPGPLLGTKPGLRLWILAVIRADFYQAQFGAQRQAAALRAAQGEKTSSAWAASCCRRRSSSCRPSSRYSTTTACSTSAKVGKVTGGFTSFFMAVR